ncbi:cupin domain-containing protein [Paraburkholderia tropica]|uniref:cupin domain-containing protein n=1 Tax=Paraburkholderia tropica TaxID=92647 RepID=UPI002AB799FC|nr:cupin domain-containing protein [Paraburkholderia tropica]
MNSSIRRVVTGHNSEGVGVVLMDGPTPYVRIRQSGGVISSRLWVTQRTPANIAGQHDRAALEIGVAPPVGGSVFRLVEFPPVDASAEHESFANEVGLSDAAAPAKRHPFMHKTESVDYAIVVSGEIDLLLDDSEVHLKAGDAVVQQGTDHAWVNRGSESCRIAFVLIDAKND